MMNRMLKHGQPGFAGMSCNVLCGGLWTRQRRYPKYADHDRCPFCDEHIDSLLHRCLTCKHWRTSDLDDIKASQHLVPRAEQGCAAGWDSWGLRGIPPDEWVQSPLPEEPMEYFHNFAGPGSLSESDVFFLDGSCDSADPRLRRCAWAIVWLLPSGALAGSIYGTCGEGKHTAPKAELLALIHLAEHIRHDVVAYTDCWHVFDGYQRKEWLTTSGKTRVAMGKVGRRSFLSSWPSYGSLGNGARRC